MSSATVGTHSGAGPLSLMSCVRESSPLQDFDSDNEKNVASKRKFWNPRKWFKRKTKVTEEVVTREIIETEKDAFRSRSTSELFIDEEDDRRRSSSSMHPGLSVSHDSVFHSPNSGSDLELDAAQSSSSLSISQPLIDSRLQTELSERLRLRRSRGDTSEDDEGLPHSPCNSPTASDGLLLDKTAIKDLQSKSHSTCSDGSLLSMDSYEDEDSLDPHSRCSSKVSLREKTSIPDNYLEFGTSSNVAPLNHSAAHHRVSVKPKRKYGAPRRSRGQQLATALPMTPEVNEDSSIRSISPEVPRKESLTELTSMNTDRILTEIQLKCSSLPPGMTAPGSENSKLNRSKSNAGSKSQDPFSPLHEENEKEEKLSFFDRLFPRKSGRKKKSKEQKEAKQEVQVEESSTQQWEESSRLDEEGDTVVLRSHAESSATYVSTMSVKPEVPKPIPVPRSGAASRQRVLPIDIPSTPDGLRKESAVIATRPASDKSPTDNLKLQAELENILKYRQISTSTSPPKAVSKSAGTPPQSPRRSPRSPRLPGRNILPTVISSSTTEQTHFAKSSSITTKYSESRTRNEEFLNRIKMPGLSSLQQRVFSLNNDDVDHSFNSMTEIKNENKIKPITKSHSFKAVKPQSFNAEIGVHNIKSTTADFLTGEKTEESRSTVTKAASLDSVKHLDDQIHFSEVKLEFKKSKPDVTTASGIKTEEKTSDVFKEFIDSPITISGPSHTAIVNVTSKTEDFTSRNQSTETFESGMVDGSHTISIKENQFSVTKIQVKRESTQLTHSTMTIPSTAVPEFVNKPLNRVEIRPMSNIILSMKSPRVAEEQNRPKTLFSFDVEPELATKPPAPRKFSKENLEIIEKADDASPTSPSAVTSKFKKPENKPSARQSSMVSIMPESPVRENVFKSMSTSLDSLRSESDKSSQDSLDRLGEKSKDKNKETVVLRRKSLASKKRDEEPELMKVFARRSLKLKDNEVDDIQDQLTENKTRDSDKENHTESPVDERKKLFTRSTENAVEPEFLQRRKSVVKDSKKEDLSEVKSPVKEPLGENKVEDPAKANNKGTSSPVLPKKTVNNIFLGQRAFSMNPPKSVVSDMFVKKQSSLSERKISDQWMSNIKNEDSELKDKVGQNNKISNISPNGDFITASNTFNQKKAQWEMISKGNNSP